MTDFPSDEVEFRGAWNQCAGKTVALAGAITKVEERAAHNFIKGRDDAAEELRSLAKDLKRLHSTLNEELEGYIAESQKRDWEIRKVRGK